MFRLSLMGKVYQAYKMLRINNVYTIVIPVIYHHYLILYTPHPTSIRHNKNRLL